MTKNNPSTDWIPAMTALLEGPTFEPWDLWDMPGYRSRKKPRRVRRPSAAALIKQAERLGKNISSITAPDGTTLHLGEPEPTETTKNPWLADLNKVKQQ
jgi:hypothetical protein